MRNALSKRHAPNCVMFLLLILLYLNSIAKDDNNSLFL